jgi:hypothetical protein
MAISLSLERCVDDGDALLVLLERDVGGAQLVGREVL